MNMLPMANGAEVLRADLLKEETGMAGDATLGVVLCRTRYGGDLPYVTWNVFLDQDEQKWHASTGNYFMTLDEALADFDRRRNRLVPTQPSR